MKKKIDAAVAEAVFAIQALQSKESKEFIESAAKLMAGCLENGGKILIAGNGGSLCDAMHFAEELTGFFRKKRKGLPAIALSDPGHITCTANDSSYDQVFERYVEALGKKDDVLVCLTTSGNSPNLCLAMEQAKKMEMTTVSFLGKSGGKMKGQADLEWHVQGLNTSDRVQEVHMAAIHIIIEMIEEILFKDAKSRVEDIIFASVR